jgi:hypothetical protein
MVVGLGRSCVKTLFLALILTTLIPQQVNAINAYSIIVSATFQLTPGDVIAPHLYVWSLDGSSGYLQIPATASISGLNNITVMVFINWLGGLGQVAISKFTNAAGSREWMIYANPSANKWVWQIVDDSTSTFSEAFGLYPAARLDHITAVYSNFNQLLYENASLTASKTTNITIRSTTAPINIGRSGDGVGYFQGYIYYVVLYSRALYQSEITNAYNKNEFNSLNLTLFLDATFWDATKYVDLSGNNNNAQPSLGGVTRVLDNKTWLYHIVQLYNDNQVHFRFFPYGSKIEIYDTSGKLVTSFYLNGNADAANMIEDYAISLSPGTYKIVAYMLQTSFSPGYPANYCGIIQNTDTNAIVSCSCDGLMDRYGIYIDNPDTSQTYTFVVSTTYTTIGDRILFSIYPNTPPQVIIKLPLQSYTLRNGSQISITGLKVRITYIENTTAFQSIVILTPDNYTGSLTLTFNQYDVITEVALFFYSPTPPQALPPTPSSIYDVKGWIAMLAYMAWQFVQYIPTALQILVQVGVWFTQLVPLFVAIIPLSIIGALVEGGVEDAVKVASFWYELARKLYDFFIKVIQAIAELIQALKPV